MRILIMGGGRFLGRAFAAQSLAGGHEVTVFNRGRSGVDLDGVRAVRGDREKAEDLERLVADTPATRDGGPAWDAVVDTCGFTPAVVEASARMLAGRSRAYLFVSSVNAYARWPAEAVAIDARDIARFGLRCIENGHYGAFPTAGPGTETMRNMLEACVRATGSGARLLWADDEFLTSHGVEEWTGLPAWSVAGTGGWDVASQRAADAGLVCRPVEETVRDTWAWLRDVDGLGDEDGRINGHGLAPATEAALLAELTREN